MHARRMQSWASLFQLILIIYVVCLAFSSQDNRNEDDDIISEAMTKNVKRNGVEKSNGYITQGNNVGVDAYSQNNIGRTDAASIVGDVNKYGLWEYTSDNTEMGEQINSLMKKAQNADVASELRSRDIEKQANKMNAEINKYAESGPNPSPTIDPMETPEGYAPTAHQVSYGGPDLSPIINHNTESIDVVTIPNTMTIEDEHGNSLDAVKASPIKSFANVEPTKTITKDYENQFPSHSMVINNPTSKLLHRRPISPTTGLTRKLLKALKTSKIFRSNAVKLLATPADSDIEVFKKQRRLAAFLKAYDKAYSKDESDKLTENDSKYTDDLKQHYRNSMQGTPLDKNDGRLLQVIKNLMKGDSSSSQRDELHDLLAALKSSEKNAAKMETEFTDTPGNSNTGETSMSDPHLQHFKEFVHKHKQSANHHEAEDPDHPLGTDSASSPLMGYLEQETAAVNSIKDPADNPKEELTKLGQMMVKMEKNNEELRKQHEQEMVDQFKKLLREGKENKEENQKIAENNGDEGKPIEAINTKESKFGENVYKIMKNTEEYQKFIAAHNAEETKSNGGETKDTTTESEKEESSSTDGANGGEEFKSIHNQLKEIEMQRELLKIKEQKLKMMNEEREGQMENESVKNKTKTDEKTNEKEKESVEEQVDHMLHLAAPKQYKHISPKEESSDVNAQSEDQKQKELEEGKSNDDRKNVNLKQENEKQSETANVIAHTDDEKQKEPEEGKSNADNSKVNLKQEENIQKPEKIAKALHDLKSEEQFKIIDAHEAHDEVGDSNSIIKNENNDETSAHEKPKDQQSSSRNDLLKYHKKKERLGLPITNPSPKDDNGMEPHPNFHHTYHSFDESDHSPSKAPSNVIAPIHSPLRETSETKREHRHFKGPSILDSSDMNTLPPAGMGKPSVLSEKHHVYPIEEPPPLLSYHNDSNHRAVVNGDDVTTVKQGAPNTLSNLLKHKSIPSRIAEIDIEADSNDLHVEPYASIIKPKSSRFIDVTATKKGFGERPRKPKSYLLKELRQKLRMLAMKRHLTNQFLKRLRRRNGTMINNSNTSFENLSIPFSNEKSKRLLTPHYKKKHNAKNTSILVPASTSNKIITINHTNTSLSDSNVIIPGSEHEKLAESSKLMDTSYQGVNPADITRSILPKVKNSTYHHESIEDVFNILGSEDQISKRTIIHSWRT